MKKGSAVDEGRNPYGKPGHGNFYEAWRALCQLPCPKCGSQFKSLIINETTGVITIECKYAQVTD
jgi:hypothetical protein